MTLRACARPHASVCLSCLLGSRARAPTRPPPAISANILIIKSFSLSDYFNFSASSSSDPSEPGRPLP